MITASPDLLADALGYLDRGFSCVPVAGKRPVIEWKTYAKRLPTETELRQWIGDSPATGIAVIAGDVSGGLAVRDFDTQDAYTTWADANPSLARQLPTAATARGKHVWCRTDKPIDKRLSDGEFRGTGITVAPHSLHRSGRHYEWLIGLPKRGRLPLVEHHVFTLADVSERQNAISDVSEHSDSLKHTNPASVCLPSRDWLHSVFSRYLRSFVPQMTSNE